MIDESSYSEAVAEELSLTSSAYAEDVAGEVDLTSSAYGEDVAEAINEGVVPPTPVEPYDLRVMQFNVGHFNMGTTGRPYSGSQPNANNVLINSTKSDGYPSSINRNYDVQKTRWGKFISAENADIIGAPEWNSYFGWDNNVLKTVVDADIFGGYNISEGDIVYFGWWQNTLLSKLAMSDAQDVSLGSKTGVPQAYVREAHVTVNGKQVTIAVTHLNWSQSETYEQSRAIEIATLVNRYKDMDYVILCGDFNTDGGYPVVRDPADKSGLQEFQPFVDAGFTLANQYGVRELLTSAASNSRPDLNYIPTTPANYLDNIIVKGFTMSNVMVLDTGVQVDNGTVDVGMLSDHCAVVCDLTMIEEGGES